MTHNTQQSTGFELTGKHVLLCFIAFFGVIIAVNFTMATVASRTWTGLVVKNSYVASQNFNDDLSKASAQQAKGWHSQMRYEKGLLVLDILDREGNPLNVKTAVLKIGRPAFEQEDKISQMQRQAKGSFMVELPLANGEWQLNVSALLSDGVEYRRDARLVISKNNGGKIQ